MTVQHGPGFYDCVIPYLYLLGKLWVHCTSMLGLFFISVFAQRARRYAVCFSSLLSDLPRSPDKS